MNLNFNTFKRSNYLLCSLIALLTLLIPSNKMLGATYSHIIDAKVWSAYGEQTLNGVKWTSAGTTTSYFGYDATKGQQFGSANSPATSLTLSTADIPGTISSVKVSTSGASSIAGTVSVTVGGTSLSPASTVLTATNTTHEFTGSKSGTVVISWTQTSSKALYLKAIEITYSSSAATATPTFSPAAGTYTSAQNVTISSTTQGAKIYYTTDGSTPDNTKTLYQTAISVNTTTTIKAIAYDSNNQNPSNLATALYTINTPGPATPVATTATNINSTGFTANWSPVENATEYKLNVYKQTAGGGTTTVLSENFDNFSGGATGSGASSTDVSTSLDEYTQTVGWTGTKIYQAGGTVKLGTSSVLGSIVSPSINLSANEGSFNLSFKTMAWSSDATEMYIYLNDVLVYTVQELDNSSYTLKSFSIPLTGGTASSKIKFEGKQASKGRFFLEDLIITQGGTSQTSIEGSPFTITGNTSKIISGLIPSTTYKYNISAKNSQGQESAISNDISVTTTDGDTPVTEPSEHVTNFIASGVTSNSNSITLTWTDAAGVDFYLIKGSSVSYESITAPSDGIPETDGVLVKNIAKGEQTAVFSGLSSSTTYFFKIWPYMGSGGNINYKTNGSVPTAQAITTSVSNNTAIADNLKTIVSVNENKQIQVTINADLTADARIDLYTITGQKVFSIKPTSAISTISRDLQSGVYMVLICNKGVKSTYKVTL